MTYQNSTFLHAAAFVLGFGLIFTLLGASVGLVGYVVYGILPLIQQIGGVLLIIFGLVTMGAFDWLSKQIQRRPAWRGKRWGQVLLVGLDFFPSLLYTERRAQVEISRQGYVASFLVSGRSWPPSCCWPRSSRRSPKAQHCWQSTRWGWASPS